LSTRFLKKKKTQKTILHNMFWTLTNFIYKKTKTTKQNVTMLWCKLQEQGFSRKRTQKNKKKQWFLNYNIFVAIFSPLI
jgi:hypothetical protein